MSLFTLGRTFFGMATVASGLLQIAAGDFVRLVPKRPAWLLAPQLWVYVFGLVLVAIGLAILVDRMARTACAVLVVLMLLLLVLFYAPLMVSNPPVDRPFFRGFMWTAPLKLAALAGGAAMVAARARKDARDPEGLVRALLWLAPLGPVLLAVFLFVCGTQHFAYAPFVKFLVPAWMPGNRMSWVWLTGVALMAGGLGILIPQVARLAALLSGVMILLWVPMVHVARTISGPGRVIEAAGVFEALALSGVAFIVAGTWERKQSYT